MPEYRQWVKLSETLPCKRLHRPVDFSRRCLGIIGIIVKQSETVEIPTAFIRIFRSPVRQGLPFKAFIRKQVFTEFIKREMRCPFPAPPLAESSVNILHQHICRNIQDIRFCPEKKRIVRLDRVYLALLYLLVIRESCHYRIYCIIISVHRHRI